MVAYGVDASQINFPNGNVDYTKVHDEVVAIDPINMTVTLNLINGFSFGRPVWYLSMDSSNTLGRDNRAQHLRPADGQPPSRG